MITHNIPLVSFLPHGKVSLKTDNDELHIITNTTINTLYHFTDNPIKSYAYLKDKYKLPFRIDMTVKIDSPAMYLMIGNGHIGFATNMDNRRITGILGNDNKPNTYVFDNNIPINKYTDISVVYGKKAMWVIVNDDIRCFSNKASYIKVLKNGAIPEEFSEGFGLAIACDKRTQLTLKSLTITEYENEEPVAPAVVPEIKASPVCLSKSEKPTIDECVKGLTPNLQKEILRTDEYLQNDVKKSLKLKRKIEGGYPCSRIQYTSDWGFNYRIQISDACVWHDIGWITYNTKREQEKYGGYKKADHTLETLKKLAEDSPKFADEMFFRMKECVACGGEGAKNCIHNGQYEYNGRKKTSCNGNMHFKMFPSDFEDVRKIVGAINDVFSAHNDPQGRR